MKKILFSFAVMLFSAATIFANDKVKTAEIKTKIFCDHCKLCGTCSDRIEEALYNQKGVKRVDIDDSNMIIKVAYNEDRISLKDIKQTIAAYGYDADDIKATAEAVAQLDDCCRESE